MLFAKKSKGFCVEIGEHTTLLARLSRTESPLVVEELKELATADIDAIAQWTKGSAGKGATGYAHATCSVFPSRRVVRRFTLDPKRAKDPAYLNEIYTQQLRVEPERFALRVLDSESGGEYDASKAAQKEVLICGLPMEDVDGHQDKLLEAGIYPERLELGTVATLGGMMNYLQFKQTKSPVLLLEIGQEATHSFILGADGVDISRQIPNGVGAMIPVVQKELGLKDEESAKKLFYSNTFDFTSMGATLVKKLLKELQSSIGFYEVQTGQSIGSVFCTHLPASLSWLGTTMASSLGVPILRPDLLPWIESRGITLSEGVSLGQNDERWFGLFSLIASYQDAVPEEKK